MPGGDHSSHEAWLFQLNETDDMLIAYQSKGPCCEDRLLVEMRLYLGDEHQVSNGPIVFEIINIRTMFFLSGFTWASL